jgi:hypothetical protein
MSGSKPMGVCPKCKKTVQAIVVEKNSIRRDLCRCPECSQSILVCRVPGCHDYAMGGDFYDDELCPAHTKESIKKMGISAATIVLDIVLKKKIPKL